MKKYTAHTEIYLHIVWATWDRLPLISDEFEQRLYAVIAAKCQELQCIPLAIGGVADHVHLLVRLHAPVSVADLVKNVKGSSSHFVTHEVTPGKFFKWQGSYSAFSVEVASLPRLKEYIANQKQHHAERKTIPEWELLEIQTHE